MTISRRKLPELPISTSIINDKKPVKASVSVDGAGIVSVQSRDVLRSTKGKAQLEALKKVPIRSRSKILQTG